MLGYILNGANLLHANFGLRKVKKTSLIEFEIGNPLVSQEREDRT